MRRSHLGFTLIEVLVALVILAIALFAAFRATQSGIMIQDKLQRRLLAHWVAMNQITNAQLGLIRLPHGFDTISGESKQLQYSWRWQLMASTVPDGGERSAWVPVTVRVFDGKSSTPIEQLSTLIENRDGT